MTKNKAGRAIMCRGCWEVLQLPIFIRSPLALPYRLMGIKPSAMNPNLCTYCETRFKRLMSTSQITAPLTILFADVRDYTSLSVTVDPHEMTRLLGLFYQACAEAVWEREGLINKIIGDAVLAVFNFPLRRKDHVVRGVEAALEIQRKWREIVAAGSATTREGAVGIGIGVHTGDSLIGEVGQSLRDFTVIGPVVNLTSRLQSAAAPGEVLVTEAVFAEAGELLPGAEMRTLELKGLDQPVRAFAFSIAEDLKTPQLGPAR